MNYIDGFLNDLCWLIIRMSCWHDEKVLVHAEFSEELFKSDGFTTEQINEVLETCRFLCSASVYVCIKCHTVFDNREQILNDFRRKYKYIQEAKQRGKEYLEEKYEK